MDSVTLYDCEFLTAPGAPQRFWCGPSDPDPLCVQIGAVRLSLAAPFDISEDAGWYVLPTDRDGLTVPVDPLLTRLTGIDDALLEQKGIPLRDALAAFDAFSQGDTLLSWGKDDLLTLSASLFVQGLQSPIPAPDFAMLSRFCLPLASPKTLSLNFAAIRFAYTLAWRPLAGPMTREQMRRRWPLPCATF